MPVVDALIHLYEISGGGLPATLRFCNYTETDGSDVTFDSETYTAYPIQSANGWERSLEGALPRPTIVLSNIFGDISAAVRDYGVVNAKVVRNTVATKSLDTGTDPDTTAILRQETYYLSRVAWNANFATLFLRSPIDVENLNLPRRTVGSLLA